MTDKSDFTPTFGDGMLACNSDAPSTESATRQTSTEKTDAEADADDERPNEEDDALDTDTEGSEESPDTGEDEDDSETDEPSLGDLPPSAKLVFVVLSEEGQLTQKQLGEETGCQGGRFATHWNG